MTQSLFNRGKAGRLSPLRLFTRAMMTGVLVWGATVWGAAVQAADAEQAPVQDENQKAQAMFESLFMAELERSPESMAYLGIKKDYGKWDDYSLAREAQDLQFTKQQLKELKTLDRKKLDASTALSYDLYEQKLQQDIDMHKWVHYDYPVNQMFGLHSHIPSFLINIHNVESEEDAKAYISRLNGVGTYIDQLIDNLEVRKKEKIIAPKFVFAHVISDSENVIKGKPFTKKGEEGKDSTLLEDFKNKVNKLEIAEKQKAALIKDASQALTDVVGPAYTKLIAYIKTLEKVADTKDGAWKFPKGDKFYRDALKVTTTTDLSAKEIHQIGLDEVARIHEEMRGIMKSVKFEGDLQDFLKFMREDKQFYFPQTEAGRAEYLAQATQLIEDMKKQLDSLFLTKPKADLTVKAVEPFREKSAGKAFYQRPAPDGSRPGTYYANLYDMSLMPSYQMAALAYHEGIPGHHMQISIAQEIQDMPKFRKFGGYTAYIEGWGLYSELVPKEIGFYQDPYSDFGRLTLELWRACRLVVDTGIHYKKWTRQQAIDYLMENTPNSEADNIKAIERYIVMPSQATAYKIGMLKILELRQKSKKALGDAFDICEFHDVILKNGAVPLDILEGLVDQWIKQKKSA
ncbi:hypothetical protein TDB9533_03408 [Thalassocella blandensis]|nr:hypothetical protein TDB9533_03408 [Thalassocella blandensis]